MNPGHWRRLGKAFQRGQPTRMRRFGWKGPSSSRVTQPLASGHPQGYKNAMAGTWTSESALGLAPDEAAARAGKGLATPQKWAALGGDGQIVWGLAKGSGEKPYQTRIDLGEPAFKCSCPSRKFPCKHALGLLLLWVDKPKAFATSERPDWVQQWVQDRATRAARKEQKQVEAQEVDGETRARRQAQQEERAASHEQKVAVGIEELQVWLGDVMRRGLAAVAQEPAAFWDGTAARMVDAQAPGLARQVRELKELAGAGRNWHGRMLERLGRLYLVAQAYGRLDELPSGAQADVRVAIGWTQRLEELNDREGVRDCWAVLARHTEVQDRLRMQKTWLWGQRGRRGAMLLEFAHGNDPLDVGLPPGTAVEADLVYYDGAWPLRAAMKQRCGDPEAVAAMPGFGEIDEALAAQAMALAANPLLEEFPMPLQAAVFRRDRENWLVCDREGRTLPAAVGEKGWRLAGLSGGRPVGLFGLWDGWEYSVASATDAGRFVVL